MRKTEGGEHTAVIQKRSGRELTRAVAIDTTIVTMTTTMY